MRKTMDSIGIRVFLLICSLLGSASLALAASHCGTTAAGFQAWVEALKRQAAVNGIGPAGLKALDRVHYARATINADRSQKSFKLSYNQFMRKRGAVAIIKRGKIIKRQNSALFAKIEQKYGVPAGPIIAIWGMETAFGSYMGKQHTLSALATLAYDCRRSAFFTDQLYAALTLIDRGNFDANSIGAMHGEIGQTQFLPKNVLLYGVDGDGDGHIDLIRSKADALASTANFLVGHGWNRNAGYQEGQPNFAAIRGWNAAYVYEKAIAAIGKQIDD